MGRRFDRLVAKLRHRRRVRRPRGLAAWIGRRKYGKERFQRMAARGRRRAS